MEDVSRMPFVSIVMPNWNGKDDTLECLDSLRNLDYPRDRLEIIIVDNGSQDGSPEIIKRKYEQMKNDGFFSLKIIEKPKNIGAPAAINQGIKAAQKGFDYIFKLDNDVVMDKECLKNLIKIAENDMRIGIVGGKVYYYGEDLIQSVGAEIDLWRGFTPPRGWGEINHYQYDQVEEVDYVCGAGMLVKRKAIQKIGLLNETYFVYYDETDWSLRTKGAGFKVVYVPNAKIWHKQSISTRKISGFLLYHMTRSRIIFERKHSNFLQYICFNLYTWCYEYPKRILIWLIRDPRQLRFFLRGIRDGYSARIPQNEKILTEL